MNAFSEIAKEIWVIEKNPKEGGLPGHARG